MPRFSARFLTLRNRAVLNAAGGFGICTALSAVVAVALKGRAAPDTVPLLFLILVGLVSWFLGFWPAVLGLVGSSLVFALYLFPPIGSLAVRAPSARINLAMMLLFGIAVAYFYGDRRSSDE